MNYLQPEIRPTIRAFMEQNDLTFRQLPRELQEFDTYNDNALVHANTFRILLGVNGVLFTRWKMEGALPSANPYGKYFVGDVRDILENGVKETT